MDYLTLYAELAMLPVEPEALAQPQVDFVPATVEIEGITVEFLQLVSDGSGVLACAAVSSDEVKILPGAATLDSPAWGGAFRCGRGGRPYLPGAGRGYRQGSAERLCLFRRI